MSLIFKYNFLRYQPIKSYNKYDYCNSYQTYYIY